MAEGEIETWLKTALSSENLDDFSVQVLGNTEKGDGYVGDVVFVKVDGNKNGTKKEFDLVLKCSKKGQALREKTPIKEVFLNEICFYDKVVPSFVKFEKERGLKESFSRSVTKYFGKFVSDNMEVIVLQNLKKIGYELYERRKPLTRSHIEIVVKSYAKFHAISGALRDQEKKVFENIVSNFRSSVLKEYSKTSDFNRIFHSSLDQVFESLKDQVDLSVLEKFKDLGNYVDLITEEMWDLNKFPVVVHGDCWNNNFMYCYDTEDKNAPSRVAILDWQIMEVSSPIRDLSYFLFVCISKEDIDDLEQILGLYYVTFSDYLKKLGSDAEKLYPRAVFFEEWKKFAKYGLLMSPVLMKIVLSEQEDVKDMAEVFEDGGGFSDVFDREIKDDGKFASRMKYIVEYAAKTGLLEF